MTPDPGAAAERTRLSWRRTGLSATVVALLAARPVFDPATGAGHALLAAAAMAAWVLMVRLAYRRVRGLTAVPPRPGRRAIVAYAAITVGLAVIGGMVVTL